MGLYVLLVKAVAQFCLVGQLVGIRIRNGQARAPL